MSTDIVNWLQVNILSNPQVLRSLIALIILMVAGFLFSVKSTEKNPFRSRQVWGALLFVFAIFIFLLANIADLADVFTVWATLVLAGVAIFSFEESRRLRKQYKKREELDRKERLLNEIIEWATKILECNREYQEPGSSLFETRLRSFQNFNVLNWKGIHIGCLTDFISEHLNLNEDFDAAVEDAKKAVRQHAKLQRLALDEKLKDNAAIGRHRKKVDDRARRVIELSVKLL